MSPLPSEAAKLLAVEPDRFVAERNLLMGEKNVVEAREYYAKEAWTRGARSRRPTWTISSSIRAVAQPTPTSAYSPTSSSKRRSRTAKRAEAPARV